MAIQSSVNALMQQLYTIGAIGAGLREQKKQTKAAVANLPSFEERFRKEFKIDAKTPLTREHQRAVEWGMAQEKRTGGIVEPSRALRASKSFEKMNELREERRRSIMEQIRAGARVENEIASDLARGSVEARTASINKTKSNFDEHTASLIRYYGKGSGNP